MNANTAQLILFLEKNPERGPQGLFGEELLAAKGALIDFANRKLWFRPEKRAAK